MKNSNYVFRKVSENGVVEVQVAESVRIYDTKFVCGNDEGLLNMFISFLMACSWDRALLGKALIEAGEALVEDRL